MTNIPIVKLLNIISIKHLTKKGYSSSGRVTVETYSSRRKVQILVPGVNINY